jgi:hypothetical protein
MYATIGLDQPPDLRILKPRAAPRLRLSLPIFITINGKRHNALLCDLSSGGAMILTPADLILGMNIELHCGTICAPGTVVWQRRSGSGIKFNTQICQRRLEEGVLQSHAVAG